MSSIEIFLSNNNIEIVRNEKTLFPDGGTSQSPVCYMPIKFVHFNPKNNRFRPKEVLSDEAQSKLLRTQNPTNFNSLVESIQNQPCFEAIKLHYVNGKFELIDGHRRAEAARDAGRNDFLAIVYENLSPEQFDFIAEWNEENPTKLPHDAFYKARGIALPVMEAKSEEDRNKLIERLKRRNIKQVQIDKAINTCMYISDFAKKVGEVEEKRSDQYKAFETVAQARKEKFQNLRSLGEFEKIEKLDVLAVDFLKANLAHDDIKVALDGLAERSLEDPLWIEIDSKEIDTSKVSDLRRIVNDVRMNRFAIDIVGECKFFCQRIYGKLIANPNPQIVENLKQEFEILLQKINILKESFGGDK